MQQDHHIRRLAPDLRRIIGLDRLIEFVELATRTGDKRGKVRDLSERLVAPVADGLAGFSRHGDLHTGFYESSFAASPNAQSSHGVSASRSLASTVAPHQMRRPGGAAL